MKIVVIGGSGLIGSKVVKNLRDRGHDVLAASPSSGVNTLTGEGVAEAVKGADVVIDLANSPSFEAEAVMKFFTTAAKNLLPAEAAAGVKHHIALSIVNADKLANIPYMRAKVAQEDAIKASGVPWTIVRATQFFEFMRATADGNTVDNVARLTPALLQPIAAVDVASAVTDVALEPPTNGIVEIAGPESIGLDELGREVLRAAHDTREVVSDKNAPYYGGIIDDSSLRPHAGARLGKTRFQDWLRANVR